MSENAVSSQDLLRSQLLYQANAKSVGVAFLFWFFLGMFGAHRFYLERNGGVQLALTLIGIVLSIVVIGIFLIAAVAIWVLVDAFLISDWTRTYNMKLAERMLG